MKKMRSVKDIHNFYSHLLPLHSKAYLWHSLSTCVKNVVKWPFPGEERYDEVLLRSPTLSGQLNSPRPISKVNTRSQSRRHDNISSYLFTKQLLVTTVKNISCT